MWNRASCGCHGEAQSTRITDSTDDPTRNRAACDRLGIGGIPQSRHHCNLDTGVWRGVGRSANSFAAWNLPTAVTPSKMLQPIGAYPANSVSHRGRRRKSLVCANMVALVAKCFAFEHYTTH